MVWGQDLKPASDGEPVTPGRKLTQQLIVKSARVIFPRFISLCLPARDF